MFVCGPQTQALIESNRAERTPEVRYCHVLGFIHLTDAWDIKPEEGATIITCTETFEDQVRSLGDFNEKK